jgi:VanZ family protein
MAERPNGRGFFPLFTRFWLPVLLFVTAIGIVSAQPRLRPPVRFFHSDKLWHVLEYAVLGWLLVRAFHATQRTPRLMTASLLAVLCGVAVACADEKFQSTVPGRVSSIYDVAADTVGVLLSQVIYARFLASPSRRVVL